MKTISTLQSELLQPNPIARNAPLILLFSMVYFLMTSVVDWKYSVDLTVLTDVAGNYPFRDDFLLALVDNSTVVWLALKGEWLAEPSILLKVVYWFAFLLKSVVLIRLAGVRATVAFTALFFFSIDLNQARMSLAISLLLIAYASSERSHFVATLLILLAVTCHYPAALTLILFFTAAKYPRVTIASSLAVVGLITITILSEDSPILRYLAYIEDTGEGGQASFFIVTSILTAAFWERISPLQRVVMIISIAVSFGMRELLNLSGRVSELAATAITLWCYRSQTESSQIRSATNVFLIVGILFFSYRFGQWVLLDQVPQPSNL